MRTPENDLRRLREYYSLWHDTVILYENWARLHGLTYNSLTVLLSISGGEDSPCTQKSIAERHALPKQTVNNILKEFRVQGLLELVPVDTDRRNKEIVLTDRGRVFSAQVLGELQEVELSAVGEMDEGKMEAMIEGMELFCHHFRKGMEAADGSL